MGWIGKSEESAYRTDAAHAITRRDAIKTLAAATSLALTGRAWASDGPPNIVFFFADDLGYGDLGCYGAEDIETPNIDGIAREGIRFTSFYAAAPVCTPSRAGLLTGRYPIRTGLTKVLWPSSDAGLTPDELTIATALKSTGYKTACIGKWHLGHLPEHLPTRNGFDYFFGLPYSNDMDKPYLWQPPLPLMRNEEVIERPADPKSLTQRYTDEAIRFIGENRGGPFFLYLPYTMPHVPLAVSERFTGKSKRGLYGDVVEELDDGVGRVLGALDAHGLTRNTIVVFTSDNGPWLWQGEQGGSGGELRMGKGSTFEGGMRVPCVARWPGYIRAGRTSDGIATMMDWFPTFCGAAGVSMPTKRAIDGVDLSPILIREEKTADREFFYFSGDELQAYRRGNWKVIRPFSGFIYTTPVKHPRLLFDLDKDPGEQANLAHTYPDVAREMSLRMREFERGL